jgi:phage regulator Rha-like protein
MGKVVISLPLESVEKAILLIRGEKVMLDADLAKLYGVTTKRLNEQVKRNHDRFPNDFMFQLTSDEVKETQTSRSQTATLKRGQNIKYFPYAFTEHGAIMAANVLNSKRAVQASVQVVRAFIRLRQMLASNAELARKLNALEHKYDAQFRVVFDAIRQLMTPLASPRKQIGFQASPVKK